MKPQYIYRRGWMDSQICALAQHTAHLFTVKGVNFICLQNINITVLHVFPAAWSHRSSSCHIVKLWLEEVLPLGDICAYPRNVSAPQKRKYETICRQLSLSQNWCWYQSSQETSDMKKWHWICITEGEAKKETCIRPKCVHWISWDGDMGLPQLCFSITSWSIWNLGGCRMDSHFSLGTGWLCGKALRLLSPKPRGMFAVRIDFWGERHQLGMGKVLWATKTIPATNHTSSRRPQNQVGASMVGCWDAFFSDPENPHTPA